MNINLKIKYLRRKVKSRSYHSDRIKRLLDYKAILDERFKIFEMGGIVGDSIWNLKGEAYLDYAHRIRPMIIKRIDWHKKAGIACGFLEPKYLTDKKEGK